MKILAIIPARGGSRGVPRKNLRLLAGHSLLNYAVLAARASRYQPRVVVSTEDMLIAEEARSLGAEAPFIRPRELAGDEVPTLPVLQHALNYLQAQEDYRPDWVLLLQPTSPLRSSKHIDEALALLSKQDADSVVSLCPVEHSPYWMKTIDASGRISGFFPTHLGGERRQDLPVVHRMNGAIYITRPDIIVKEGRILGAKTLAYVMPAEASVDIDTELDFQMAELLLRSAKHRDLVSVNS